jgi:manganese/zinc/iron transport system permease protein
MMMMISGTLLVITFLLFKELKLLTFDPQFAKGLGLPTGLLNGLLMLLIVGAVVIGLQAVGVVLMSAMLITPAIAARYWTERLDYMVIISGSIGAVSGIVGTLFSTVANGMPTGPLIIVAATIIFIISLIFSPKRGLLTKAIRYYRLRKSTERKQALQRIYQICEELSTESEPFLTIPLSKVFEQQSMKRLHRMINKFIREGLLQKEGSESIKLTNAGLHESYRVVLNNRLMEVYLMNEMRFAHLQVSGDSDLSFLEVPKREGKELVELLDQYGRKPLIVPASVSHETQVKNKVKTKNEQRGAGHEL